MSMWSTEPVLANVTFLLRDFELRSGDAIEPGQVDALGPAGVEASGAADVEWYTAATGSDSRGRNDASQNVHICLDNMGAARFAD